MQKITPRYAGRVHIEAEPYEAMVHSHTALMQGLSASEVIYGVNTEVGGSSNTRPDDISALQRVLTRKLSYGVLPASTRDPRSPYQGDLVRAAILFRINSLVKGYSGVHPVIISRLQALLTHNIIPMVPPRGSISASGDLSPLAHISGAIQGKPSIRVLSSVRSGKDAYADEALAQAGLQPVFLTAKEGLAIVNETVISAACGALVLHDTNQLAVLSQILTAMTVKVLHLSPESFDALFAEVLPHPDQSRQPETSGCSSVALNWPRSKTGRTTASCARIHIPYGRRRSGLSVLENLLLANQQISIECNSTTDNLLISRDRKFLHGGNFQAKAVTSAMEKSRQAVQMIGRMMLTHRGAQPVGNLGSLAGPVTYVVNAEMGNQSLNSLALISARYTATAVKALTGHAAAHLLSVFQALDLRAMQQQFLGGIRAEFLELSRRLVEEQQQSTDRNNPCRDLPSTLWAHLQEILDQTLARGDASPLLGTASKRMYLFVRKTLGVPFLYTAVILTPTAETTATGPRTVEKTPTVGSYTSLLYRAIRRADFQPVMQELLEGCWASDDERDR
ncbi:aromatic amino acid ammonia-lyase [Aspergillus undulatus]|uniref:aromatic amino acid ammonia-lyase n=1 Tax=Aspergillus undulatus TaxID=1810928 RepID=UPI003CCD7C35